MSIWKDTALVALLLAAGPVSALSAQDATLAAMLLRADSANPEILAARATAEAAAARVPQAGAIPDPVLGLGVMNFPVTDPSFSREMMTMTTIQLGAQLPLFGKLGLREDVARHQAEAAQWEIERVRQKVRADVKASYYEIYFVDRALDVTRRNEALVADFAGLTSARYGVGTGAQTDVLKAQVERTRLDDQIVVLRERRASAAARLNALLAGSTAVSVPAAQLPEAVRAAALAPGTGEIVFTSAALDAQGRTTRPAPGIPDVAELQRLALAYNPMIQAHVRRVAAQEGAVSLAGKAKLPDVHISVAYSRRADFGDFMNLMVSVPIPIFAGRKQDQGVLEQSAVLSQHRAMHAAMVNEINAEIASLAAGLARARDQLVLLNDGILPQARTGLSSATAAYQVGRVDFLTLLDAQVTLYRNELDYHRLLADFAGDLAALERAVGKEVMQ